MLAMPSAPMRLIAHLDMDAFYASVELLRYPELKGRAVVIGGGRRHQPEEHLDPDSGKLIRRFATLRGYAGRGVATTATYEARALGLHSAMGLMKAAALAPDAVLLPVDFDQYRHYSRLFKAAVRTLAPRLEDRGIDEIYIDLTGVTPAADRFGPAPVADHPAPVPALHHPGPATAADHPGLATAADSRGRQPVPGATEDLRDPWKGDPWEQARRVARELKQAVFAATGLTCSIAVAPNKLLAKIASELDKPDGLTLLPPGEVERRIWPLPPRRINGIGPKSAARLAALGIHSIGELAASPPQWLIGHFGAHYGAWLHEAAHGRDERPVVTFSEPRSISRETTFERDLHPKRDRDELSRIFTGLCSGVSEDLQRKGYAGRTIGLKLRFDNFTTVTRDQTIERPTQEAQSIRRAAGECLKRVALTRRIRLLGVRVGGLVPQADALAAASREVREPTPSLF
jgi:DNA polymerase-4